MGPLMCRTLAKPVMGGLIRQGAEVKSLWYTLYVQAFCQVLTARQEQVDFVLHLLHKSPPHHHKFPQSTANKYAMLCLVSFTSLYAAYYPICCHCFTLEYAVCSSMQWVHSLISSVPSCWMLRAGGEDRQGRGKDRGQSRGEDRGEGAQSQRSRVDNCILSVLACTL